MPQHGSGFVVGTAGHVDHGKSELVRALTGTHPDRLEEEQRRKLSIDLGFAWLDLPAGERVGFVDVPGHIDFIENMLAGVGGIDAALLVIAADEGVMPQTIEHLAILDLLEVDRGVVAITKIDLVHDEDWLALVIEEARELLSKTNLAGSTILPVSSVSGKGLDELVSELSSLVESHQATADPAKVRLPIDRSFSIFGFGTIVTGTLQGGTLRVGDLVQVLPLGLDARVRGLQSHESPIDYALPASRVAANLSGVTSEQVARGDLLAMQGAFEPTRMIDVSIRVLSGASTSVKHNQHLKLYLGPAQRMVRVRALDAMPIEPGELGVLQLLLPDEVVTYIGDRFILRRPSPGETLGGGRVLDAHPVEKHRLGQSKILERLTRLGASDRSQVLAAWMKGRGPQTAERVSVLTGWKRPLVEGLLEDLVRDGHVVRVVDGEDEREGDHFLCSPDWGLLRGQIEGLVRSYHEQYPLRVGIPMAELRERTGLGPREFDEILRLAIREGWLGRTGAILQLADFEIRMSDSQQSRKDELLHEFQASPFDPPSVEVAKSQAGDELYALMKNQGDLVEVSDDIVFHRQAFDRAVQVVIAMIEEEGQATVAGVRDRLGSSRRYVLQLLEFLDAEGITIRVGDARELSRRSKVSD